MRGTQLAPLILFSLPVFLVGAAPAQTAVWSSNGHCYELRLRPQGIDWATAQSECLADGGYLATAATAAENIFIFSLIDPQFQDSVWLGGFQPIGSSEPLDEWEWVTGESWSYTKWTPGEPNNGLGGGEEDALAYFQAPGQPIQESWNDVPAGILLTAYVFESDGPINYCTAGSSASGCQATLSASGMPSASAGTGFSVAAAGVEGDKSGLFFFGVNGRQANSWGNGSSFQCVVPPVKRGGLLAKNGTAGACDGAFQQDFNALWAASPSKNPGAGARVQAQLWYRDPQTTSNQSTSLSDAIEFCVAP